MEEALRSRGGATYVTVWQHRWNSVDIKHVVLRFIWEHIKIMYSLLPPLHDWNRCSCSQYITVSQHVAVTSHSIIYHHSLALDPFRWNETSQRCGLNTLHLLLPPRSSISLSSTGSNVKPLYPCVYYSVHTSSSFLTSLSHSHAAIKQPIGIPAGPVNRDIYTVYCTYAQQHT